MPIAPALETAQHRLYQSASARPAAYQTSLPVLKRGLSMAHARHARHASHAGAPDRSAPASTSCGRGPSAAGRQQITANLESTKRATATATATATSTLTLFLFLLASQALCRHRSLHVNRDSRFSPNSCSCYSPREANGTSFPSYSIVGSSKERRAACTTQKSAASSARARPGCKEPMLQRAPEACGFRRWRR